MVERCTKDSWKEFQQERKEEKEEETRTTRRNRIGKILGNGLHLDKPPLGCMPRIMWNEKRIEELECWFLVGALVYRVRLVEKAKSSPNPPLHVTEN